MTPVTGFDVRSDFPFLSRRVNGKPIIYFDNAATTQKPRDVIESLELLWSSGLSNVHRAVNFLADEVTRAYEESRQVAASFIGAHAQEIVFINNSTHGINLVCQALNTRQKLRVLTSTLEHHSNLLPWTTYCEADFIPWDRSGVLDLKLLRLKLRERPDLVAVAQASNFLGTFHPVREIAEACQEHGVPLLIDASQSIAHQPVNVRDLGCTFLVFSGHKIYGPTGIGVLYVNREQLDRLPPPFVGGAMVGEVHARSFVQNDAPYRFEAGTPNIEGVIGLGAALRYVCKLGYPRIAAHENRLSGYAKQRLAQIPHLTINGPNGSIQTAPLVNFQVKGLDSGAVAKTLGARANVILRSGFHCAQPAHEELGLGPTVRASFGIYNSTEEIDAMADVIGSLARVLH